MLKKLVAAALFVALLGFSLYAQDSRPRKGMPAPFGSSKDVAFAKATWKAMEGYQHWKLTTEVYKGQSPHGKYLRLFSSFVKVNGKNHAIIVKENYGGRGVTKGAIEKDPRKWLKAVTIMLKREPGYDRDNQDWFWVKYDPSGKVLKNPKGMSLAGRVAKGMDKGCISCHSQASGRDLLFSNDE